MDEDLRPAYFGSRDALRPSVPQGEFVLVPPPKYKLVKSISYSNEEILRGILRLYVGSDRFDLDATYSKGNFYKNHIPPPTYRFDLEPQDEGTAQGDARHLPLADGSVRSAVFDPPFVVKDVNREDGHLGLVEGRFSAYKTEAELYEFYADATREHARVLEKGGIFVFKCQDVVFSGKNHFSHLVVERIARANGFEPLDLFVLLAHSRYIAPFKQQRTARKFHSFFWVFQKP